MPVRGPAVLGLAVLVPLAAAAAQRPQASGGALIPEQACFDVRHYALVLRVDPAHRLIGGSLTMRADVVADSERIALDLDPALQVGAVEVGGEAATFEHVDGRIWIRGPFRAGTQALVEVVYGGEPRVAPNPPWSGGFTWELTDSGQPWVATSCQGEGADLWWPCKDHPSDKPDGVDLRITVPDALVCAANGRLVGEERDRDAGLRTWHWRTDLPIANYSVALNIAPYEVIEREYDSTAGEVVPVRFWVLPESRKRAEKALDEFLDHLRHLEETCGPYPFRAEKYGIVETPHLGMEHQTILAYGNRFRKPSFDYDWLHHHELSHEWWGNLVTCRDWKDMWIHEGIGTYMQALYIESRRGRDAYFVEMGMKRALLGNRRPVAPREVQDSKQIYFDPAGRGSNDIYYKGSWVMHTLRWLVGDDERFLLALRRLAYPDPALEKVTDGSQCRFEDTEGVRAILERECGIELGWFFEVYLRQPKLPRLHAEREGDRLRLRWESPVEGPFPLPVQVRVGDRELRVAMPKGEGEVPLGGAGDDYEIDPRGWLLRAGARD